MLDLIASIGWGYSALTENVTFGSWPDVLYIFYYPLAAVGLRAAVFRPRRPPQHARVR